jgi:pyridinium-3,5-biscarboxylic acid mononucleotide sulfurtransferase
VLHCSQSQERISILQVLINSNSLTALVTKVPSLQRKLIALQKIIASKGRLCVAYSGGVDSGFLMLMASEILGKDAVAVFLDSPTVPRADLRHAMAEAKKAKVQLVVVPYKVMENDDFLQNDSRRCYHCRKGMMRLLKNKAKELGIDTVATGTNADDPDDYRPGLKAEKEEGLWHPLKECRLTKEDIRTALKARGVSWSDRPASPCLSSRIAYGEEITIPRLKAIEAAEEMLRKKGFGLLRVRSHGDVARIELGSAEMKEFIELHRQWPNISDAIKELGWKFVTLDLEGFKSGSMNRVLRKE